ncbi:ABC transporter substrate-binding protein [Neisseriaceae bacterium B1]
MTALRLVLPTLIFAALTACSPNNQTQQTAASATNIQPASGAIASGKSKKLAITAITEHPALDDIRKGVLDQLKAEGFEEGKNLSVDFQSAQGNPSTAAQIAKKFAGDKPDVIVPIATPSAQAVVAATQDIPVVYAGITDPIGAKLVVSWEPNGTNVTGMSNQTDIAPSLDLMRELLPDLKAIGYVYSPGEVNSVTVLKQLQEATKKHNIQVIDVPAQTTSQVLTAARSLKGKVQIIFTAHDNNVVAAYTSMYKAAVEMQIPLLAADSNSVSKGAALALGVNDYNLGKETGKMVAQVLNGKAAGQMASQRASELELVISPKHAAEQGLKLPESVSKRANKTLE